MTTTAEPHGDAPIDDVGAETLKRMAGLEAYNRWLHDRFDAFLGRRVLEIGSGIGNQTRYFVDRDRVIASISIRTISTGFARDSRIGPR